MTRFIDSFADYGNEVSFFRTMLDHPMQTLHERFCYSMAGRAGWLGTFWPQLSLFSHAKWSHFARIVNQFAHYINSTVDPGQSLERAAHLSKTYHLNRENIWECKPFNWDGFNEAEVMSAKPPMLSVAETGPEVVVIADNILERSEIHGEPDGVREARQVSLLSTLEKLGFVAKQKTCLRDFDSGHIRFPFNGPRKFLHDYNGASWPGTTNKKLKYVIFSSMSSEMQWWRPVNGETNYQLRANLLVRHLRYFFNNLKARGLGKVEIFGVCPKFQFGETVAMKDLERRITRKS